MKCVDGEEKILEKGRSWGDKDPPEGVFPWERSSVSTNAGHSRSA